MELKVAERKKIRMKYEHGYTREIVNRELSEEEVEVLVDVLEVANRVIVYKVAQHDREEFRSYINEEAYLLACKWDGKGGLRNLGGFIFRNLELYASNFRSTARLREMKYLASPELKGDDSIGGTIFAWEHSDFATNDEYGLDGHDIFIESLNYNQKYILNAIYEGRPIKSITEHLSCSAKYVFNERDRIRTKAREFFGDGYGNGYARRKNAKKGR